MRTIVDLPEHQIKSLDSLGKKENISRAELVRRAVGQYLEAEQARKSGEIVHDIRGLLKSHPGAFGGMDGLEYERAARGEWDDRDRLYGNWGLNDKPQSTYEPPKKRDE
jgi:hypothetical protein